MAGSLTGAVALTISHILRKNTNHGAYLAICWNI